MTIGELISERRELKSWSIRHLAYKTNISRDMICRIEQNQIIPRMDVAAKLAKALDISLLEIAEVMKNE